MWQVSRCGLGVMHNEKKQEEKDSYEINCNNEMQNKMWIRKRVDKIKVKSKLDDAKEEGVSRLFSFNCNDLGLHSEEKIEQLKLTKKIRKIDGLMISSSDVRCNTKNNKKMLYKLKHTNKNSTINNSDSGDDVDNDSYFLKGGDLTALWSSIGNHSDMDWMCKQ